MPQGIEEFKTAAKKAGAVTSSSRTANKVSGLSTASDIALPSVKKLSLKKSQSVALPLLPNDEDTPMKEENDN